MRAMNPTATRFAPSPTGHLHLGNVRTAFFNWLLARRNGGRFVLRSEDTDAERSRDDYLDALMEDLAWLGLDWDEGPDCGGDHAPYRQVQRGDVYAAYFDKLSTERHAYPCFC
ncbi:MAG: glutamate--tRNA ligase family protein, partial [Chromatiales bacterium]